MAGGVSVTRAGTLTLFALVALTACSASRGVVPGSPDYVAASGPRVWMDGEPAQPEATLTLECMHERIDAICPAALRAQAEEHWRALRVHWARDPFFCLSIWVHGCVLADDEVMVSSLASLADESGHVAWEACVRGWGERRITDGGLRYDDDFAAWVSPCRPGAP